MKKWLSGAVTLLMLSSPYGFSQGISQTLDTIFRGNAMQFGYGGGTSSNNPRVELLIHYCANGYFYSSGRSCRPNIIAKGYQCTPIQDYGTWQFREFNGQGVLHWVSNNSGPGSLPVYLRNDGSVADQRGNPFYPAGRAQCYN